MSGKHVLVGFSGGMDSCAAVHFLKEEGYRVTAVYLVLYEKDPGPLSKHLRQLSDRLNIPLIIEDRRAMFRKIIIESFTNSYLSGKTPNPCIWCNEHVKLKALADLMKSRKASLIATGHYAKKELDPDSHRWFIKRGRDRAKDQSYFLSFVSQGHLEKLLLPLGGKTKKEIRELMVSLRLPIPEGSESHEICFLEGESYTKFISDRHHASNSAKGAFINAKGEVLGVHSGIYGFTIGQRRGIGIADKTPYYVTALYPEKNQVQIGKVDELYKSVFYATDCRWHLPCKEKTIDVSCQIRYRHPATPAILKVLAPDRVEVTFSTPQKAITPGQIAAFYRNDRLMGAGIIEKIVS